MSNSTATRATALAHPMPHPRQHARPHHPTRPAPSPAVAVVRWPSEAARQAQLAERGDLRLLLVEHGHPVPMSDDPAEDWMFADGTLDELVQRSRALEAAGTARPALPEVDADDLVRFEGQWRALAPTEARLLRVLLDRLGHCVPRSELARAVGGDDARLRSAVKRLRDRVTDLGLRVTTVRRRGVLLSIDRAGDGGPTMA